jgi:uncharacterized protein (DUF1015 family)
MAVVKPFCGITYNLERFQDLGTLVTPPYDVISASEQEAYYLADPYNVIRLELARVTPDDTESDNRYTRAAETYRGWLREGVLRQAKEPCFYVTAHTYQVGQERRTRMGIIARVQIEEEGSDVILPHEQTFPAHKTDRLKLMEACRAQFSQVFSVYEDPENLLGDVFSACESSRPRASFSFKDGSEHRMWTLTDAGALQTVENAFKGRTLYIADGHHRSETARNYRNAMRAKGGGAGEDAHEYVMMYLSAIDDRGLTILPYHRLLAGKTPFDAEAFVARASEFFSVNAIGLGDGNDAGAIQTKLVAAGARRTSFVVCTRTGDCLLLQLKPEAFGHVAADLHPALRGLDVQVLSDLIFQKTMGFTPRDMENDALFRFDSSIESCLAKVRSGDAEAAFLLNPTPIEAIREVAAAGLVMPRKSTFFHPKVLTGLVLNPLEDYESH